MGRENNEMQNSSPQQLRVDDNIPPKLNAKFKNADVR